MLLEEHLAAWLKSAGVGIPLSYDVLPEVEPHTCAALSVIGGLGLTTNAAFDRPTFSVLTRGPNGRVARDEALTIDAAILDSTPQFDIGPYVVIDRGRFGGPPSFVVLDDRNRALRTATYWLEIER